MHINFSITAEDPETVGSALAIQPRQRIICLCSAGDTPLNLLTFDPAVVDAVDFNPAQIHLGTLKAVGLKMLPSDAYHALLGVLPNRLAAMQAYEVVRPLLPVQTRLFWDSHRSLIRHGVLWQGQVQRRLRIFAAIVRTLGLSKVISEFERIGTRDDAATFQVRFIDSGPYRWVWRLLLNGLTYRAFCSKRARQRVESSATPGGRFLIDRIRFAATRAPVARKYLLPHFLGRYEEGEYPAYLNPACADSLRGRIDRIRFHEGDIEAYLRGLDARSIDGIALSNVADWLDLEDFQRLLRACSRVTRIGGRILAYSRIAPLEISEGGNEGIHHLKELSLRLTGTDRTGYYPHIAVFESLGKDVSS